MNPEFKLKGKYTLVTISRMSIAVRQEIIISSIDSYTGIVRYKLPRGKTECPLEADMDKTLVFNEHKLPFTLASEQGRFRSTGRFEFRGNNPEELKAFISKNCLNGDSIKYAKIMISTGVDDPHIYLFPQQESV